MSPNSVRLIYAEEKEYLKSRTHPVWENINLSSGEYVHRVYSADFLILEILILMYRLSVLSVFLSYYMI